MAKLAFLLATILFVAVAVSACRTIVTTVEMDEENSSWIRGHGRCTQKLERANLRPCERYIKEQCREEEEEMIALSTRRNENLDECCEQFKDINGCQCQALKSIMQREGSQLEGRLMHKFLQQLQRLPKKCGIQLPQCELGGIES